MKFSIGNKTINAEQQLDGFHVGNIRLETGATLHANGFTIGNIFIEAGAALIVDGFMIGNIINHGGSVVINGMVIGNTINKGRYKEDLKIVTALPDKSFNRDKLPPAR